jgi:hypothetical protein
MAVVITAECVQPPQLPPLIPKVPNPVHPVNNIHDTFPTGTWSDTTIYFGISYYLQGVLKTVIKVTTVFNFKILLNRIQESGENFVMRSLINLYFLPIIVRVIKSRRMRWAGHVARMRKGRGVYRVLMGTPEEKRPLGRRRRRWEDNIKMDLQEVGCEGIDWIELAQDKDMWRALANTFGLHKMSGIS